MEFKVKWEIDVEAQTHEEAARSALDIMRDPESLATVFWVRENILATEGKSVDAKLIDAAKVGQ